MALRTRRRGLAVDDVQAPGAGAAAFALHDCFEFPARAIGRPLGFGEAPHRLSFGVAARVRTHRYTPAGTGWPMRTKRFIARILHKLRKYDWMEADVLLTLRSSDNSAVS